MSREAHHLHEHHETAVYILSGELVLWYGENLREELAVRCGEFAYIPAGVPHVAHNPSATEPAAGVVARTDPNDQESAVLLPELDGLRYDRSIVGSIPSSMTWFK